MQGAGASSFLIVNRRKHLFFRFVAFARRV